jgi:7,8-dihydropterin-6-yl-methyl-4-(beta-D-ribofuranosyl)aminobenzene 5'-phosphate synthase
MEDKVALDACDRLTIHVVVDNYVEILGRSQPHVKRLGLDHHFHPRGKPVKADGGICLVIDVWKNERRKRILVDGAFCSDIVLHNMEILGIDPATIDEAVLSHGHPDHFTGLAGAIKAIGHPVPLLVHPDAFLPRCIIPADGFTMTYLNRELTVERLTEAGACVLQTISPIQLGPGLTTSGQMEPPTGFELEVPKGRLRVRNHVFEPDPIQDDVALFCNVKDRGLFVISFCGHNGIINTISQGRKMTGVDKVFGVVGGFHLGHPGISVDKIEQTLLAMKEMGVEFLAPFHCSGMAIRRRAPQVLPEAYVEVGAATVIDF